MQGRGRGCWPVLVTPRPLHCLPWGSRHALGAPWRSSGWDSELPLQGTWVQSLVEELRSGKPRYMTKNKLHGFGLTKHFDV